MKFDLNKISKILGSFYYEPILEQEKQDNIELMDEIMSLNDDILELKIENCDLNNIIDDILKDELKIERYLSENYEEIDNIAYKNKRYVKEEPISLYLNELITPNSFEVLKLKNKISFDDDLYKYVISIGNKVSQTLTWTSDNTNWEKTDYYSYPNETIVNKKEDCESHAFVVSSIYPEIAVAYGFYINANYKTGHAFNFFVQNDREYILETTGNTAEIYEYPNEKYDIVYIITKNKTFRLKKGYSFGSIAEI